MIKYFLYSSVLGLAILGCHSIRSIRPGEITLDHPPQRIWVRYSDQSIVTVEQPQVRGDTLSGMVYGEPEQFPLSGDIQMIAQRPATGRTIALAIGGSVALIAGIMYMESRPDVGNAEYCGRQFGNHPMPFTPCCFSTDSVPC